MIYCTGILKSYHASSRNQYDLHVVVYLYVTGSIFPIRIQLWILIRHIVDSNALFALTINGLRCLLFLQKFLDKYFLNASNHFCSGFFLFKVPLNHIRIRKVSF
jgi:hypothetical protein